MRQKASWVSAQARRSAAMPDSRSRAHTCITYANFTWMANAAIVTTTIRSMETKKPPIIAAKISSSTRPESAWPSSVTKRAKPANIGSIATKRPRPLRITART